MTVNFVPDPWSWISVIDDYCSREAIFSLVTWSSKELIVNLMFLWDFCWLSKSNQRFGYQFFDTTVVYQPWSLMQYILFLYKESKGWLSKCLFSVPPFWTCVEVNIFISMSKDYLNLLINCTFCLHLIRWIVDGNFFTFLKAPSIEINSYKSNYQILFWSILLDLYESYIIVIK